VLWRRCAAPRRKPRRRQRVRAAVETSFAAAPAKQSVLQSRYSCSTIALSRIEGIVAKRQPMEKIEDPHPGSTDSTAWRRNNGGVPPTDDHSALRYRVQAPRSFRSRRYRRRRRQPFQDNGLIREARTGASKEAKAQNQPEKPDAPPAAPGEPAPERGPRKKG
jgi:hypothetical protein